jgi:hypothetical protein
VPDVKDMRRWLTRAIQRQGGGGLSAAGFGVSASGGASGTARGVLVEVLSCIVEPQAGPG